MSFRIHSWLFLIPYTFSACSNEGSTTLSIEDITMMKSKELLPKTVLVTRIEVRYENSSSLRYTIDLVLEFKEG